MRGKFQFACFLLVALSAGSIGHTAEWMQTWGAAPLPPSPAVGPFPATPSFENVTIRQVVHISGGGRRVRIRFTNEYGGKPLLIGAARLALVDESGAIKAASDHAVTFDGQASVSIPAGAPLLSDPIPLQIRDLATLSISVYLPEATGACTCHATGMQSAFVSDPGDFTDIAFAPQQTIQSRAFISGVEVERPKGAQALVVLGDSISDGVGSTVDANRRWPDRLAERLNTKTRPGWGVVNMGISGNRVLSDGAGQSALARFDRDVLAVPGVRVLVIFEGVNDLGVSYGHPEGPMADVLKNSQPPSKATSDSLMAGYRQLIDRAHAHGLKVLVATITPYAGAFYYSDEGEAIRQRVNAWIRSNREIDGVLDFDKVVRDPANPTQIRDGYHPGDHLHGTDAAYAAMAAAVDLSLLR
ncbi:MAG TPA: SGNH/GDSL hydrolase family protein [Steroidobacteraceae bacterium]|jgi:lysophospholipase L1-like esterase